MLLPFNDPDALRLQYDTPDKLRVRHEIYEIYSEPNVDFPSWALDCIHWRGDETVLDVGCGTGSYYRYLEAKSSKIHYYGLDIYSGMLQPHPAQDKILQADAQFLPFPDQSFDVVMGNHMLYHVRDIDATINEIKRVLKPEGLLLAATNSALNMPEFYALFRRAILLLSSSGTLKGHVPLPSSEYFTLESGARQLSRHFYAVVRYDLPGNLVFTDSEPAMRYLESVRGLREPQLPDEIRWDDVMMIIRQQIDSLRNHIGGLVVSKLSGVLVASNRGGFIHDFVEMQENLER